ncbi:MULTISPECIES: ATP-binding protein [unclassified Blautia]|nr:MULTISPECIES: ATP-binding protein [unclassified Blautia]
MEAVGLSSFKKSLIEQNKMKLLPGAAIYGKNGGGKSNVIRAF